MVAAFLSSLTCSLAPNCSEVWGPLAHIIMLSPGALSIRGKMNAELHLSAAHHGMRQITDYFRASRSDKWYFKKVTKNVWLFYASHDLSTRFQRSLMKNSFYNVVFEGSVARFASELASQSKFFKIKRNPRKMGFLLFLKLFLFLRLFKNNFYF